MVAEINFVASVHKQLSKTYQKDRVWFRVSAGIFSLVFVLFLISVGVRFYYISQVQAVQTQEQQARVAITAQEQIEREYLVFAKKLSALSTLFAQRQDKQSAVDFFTQLFGNQVIIRELDYGGPTGNLQFMIEVPSVFVLDEVYAKLKEVRDTQTYKALNTSDLQRFSTGAYTLKIAVDVSQPTEAQKEDKK